MPSNPPTVADLEDAVARRCAVALAEAGQYLRDAGGGSGPVTPAIREGLRKGAKCVGIYLADPLTLADADVLNLSPYGVERVLDEAELHALRVALLHWHRAVQKYEEMALSPNPMAGGWLVEERRNVRERAASLEKGCSEPYREPSDPMVFADPASSPAGGWPGLPCGYYGWERPWW